MSKDFLRNEKEVREESRETLDYLNEEDEDEGFLRNEFKKLRKLSGGIL
ncbi:MAG: hypothetical protein ABEJ95_03365 [Candidatus Nanohalobium sp.]